MFAKEAGNARNLSPQLTGAGSAADLMVNAVE
jgi:hypothetical protein